MALLMNDHGAGLPTLTAPVALDTAEWSPCSLLVLSYMRVLGALLFCDLHL